MSDSIAFWRVTPSGARKSHLTQYEQGKGSGTIALCGTPISQDKRFRAPSEKITAPLGNECQACLRMAGFITANSKPPRKVKSKSVLEQRMDAFNAFVKVLAKYKIDADIQNRALLAAWDIIS